MKRRDDEHEEKEIERERERVRKNCFLTVRISTEKKISY